MLIEHVIEFDFAIHGVTPRIYGKQGDTNSRGVAIALFERGQPWEIPAGALFSLNFRTASGKSGMYDTLPDGSSAFSASGNTVHVSLAAPVFAEAGPSFCELTIVDTASGISTWTFIVVVEASPITGEQVPEDYYNSFLSIASRAEVAADKAEAAADRAENAIDFSGNYNDLTNKPVLVNPNLLDNWYFGNPVNQRGETEYTGNKYGIDRWRIISKHTMKPTGEGLKITVASSSSLSYLFNQAIERFADLLGRTVTVSALIVENTCTSPINFRFVASSAGTLTAGATGLFSATYKISTTATNLDVGMQISDKATNDGNYFVIKAMKLEIGNTQTLAHQDENGNWVLNEIPDYGEQLARCQRYLQRFRTADLRKSYCEDFRPTMRMTDNGVVSVFEQDVDGATYYFASAEL